MKQLTKEEQEQAVELIEKSIQDEGMYSEYIQSAKTFLQSLKPKIYIGCVDKDSVMIFLKDENKDYWRYDIEQAKVFNEYDEAKAALDYVEKYQEYRYFILTE
jgi:Rad3-related DNA helicase